MQNSVQFDAFEHSKENIAPSAMGYSAVKLSKAFGVQSSNDSASNEIKDAKTRFEQQIADCEELDDPLEPWLEYIQWTLDTFPQGQTAKNGLVEILERCIDCIMKYDQYKQDPRFMKIFLRYAHYTDEPNDVFKFMESNEIAVTLAAYYEDYTAYLESINRPKKCAIVYERGISRRARPLERLKRHYHEFLERQAAKPAVVNEQTSPQPAKRGILGQDRPQVAATPAMGQNSRSKIQVFTDNTVQEDQGPGDSNKWESIGTFRSRKKENVQDPSQWVGQTMSMATKKAPTEKLIVFNDVSQPVKKDVKAKRPEIMTVDLNLVYPNDQCEYCLEEIRAMTRKRLGRTCRRADEFRPTKLEETPKSSSKFMASQLDSPESSTPDKSPKARPIKWSEEATVAIKGNVYDICFLC